MLEIKDLTVERGGRLLFEDINVCLKPGQALHVCGQNGSGKSSLIKTLVGLSYPAKGSVNWNGETVENQKEIYHANLLYIGHKSGVNKDLTAEQNLCWYTHLSSVSELDSKLISNKQIEAFKYFGLYGFEDIAVGKLSAGQQRRISLCRLILEQKPLWILDEPLVSLDQEGVFLLERLLAKHLQNGGMLVYSSHQTLAIEADKLQLIHLGKHNHFTEVK